jgi:small subunit ribosomal protein S6
MRTYELVLIFDPAMEMEQIEGDLQKLNEMMVANGLPRRWERWGKRRLAYEIKGRQYGYYALAVFDMENAQVGELERSVRLNPAVIRHLVTVVDPPRVPEVDEEAVRTLGAGVAAPEVVEVKPEGEALEGVDIPADIEPDSIESLADDFTEPAV